MSGWHFHYYSTLTSFACRFSKNVKVIIIPHALAEGDIRTNFEWNVVHFLIYVIGWNFLKQYGYAPVRRWNVFSISGIITALGKYSWGECNEVAPPISLSEKYEFLFAIWVILNWFLEIKDWGQIRSVNYPKSTEIVIYYWYCYSFLASIALYSCLCSAWNMMHILNHNRRHCVEVNNVLAESIWWNSTKSQWLSFKNIWNLLHFIIYKNMSLDFPLRNYGEFINRRWLLF